MAGAKKAVKKVTKKKVAKVRKVTKKKTARKPSISTVVLECTHSYEEGTCIHLETDGVVSILRLYDDRRVLQFKDGEVIGYVPAEPTPDGVPDHKGSRRFVRQDWATMAQDCKGNTDALLKMLIEHRVLIP